MLMKVGTLVCTEMDAVLFVWVQCLGSRLCYMASTFQFLNSQYGQVSKYSHSV